MSSIPAPVSPPEPLPHDSAQSVSLDGVEIQLPDQKSQDISSAAVETPSPTPKADSYAFLHSEFLAHPFLRLLKDYLVACNPRQRSVEHLVLEFRKKHHNVFRFLFCCDAFLLVIAYIILVVVVCRGLGILHF